MNWPLLGNIGLLYAILIFVNVPAPFIGLTFSNEVETTERLWFQPPGYVIPIVWYILFTLMGIARYTLQKTNPTAPDWPILGLAVLCASYAYYTLGLAQLTGISALWFGLIGNGAVITAAGLVVYSLRPYSVTASNLIIPTIIWTVFASLIVLGEMKRDGLL